MRWTSLVLSAVLAGGVHSAEPAISVKPSGLCVVAPASEETLQAFFRPAGTTVALLIASPAGGLIQFDGTNSTVSKFTDDKGNDLFRAANPDQKPIGGVKPGFGLFPTIAKDGKACLVEIFGPRLPAKEAATLQAEGVITVLTASQKKDVDVKDVPLQKGSKIALPNLELVIEAVQKPDLGDDPLAVVLRAEKDMDEIKEIKFFDAAGKEIKSRLIDTSRIEIVGKLQVDWNFSLAQKADVATIKVTLWSDLKKERVPFSVKVDVGM